MLTNIASYGLQPKLGGGLIFLTFWILSAYIGVHRRLNVFEFYTALTDVFLRLGSGAERFLAQDVHGLPDLLLRVLAADEKTQARGFFRDRRVENRLHVDAALEQRV